MSSSRDIEYSQKSGRRIFELKGGGGRKKGEIGKKVPKPWKYFLKSGDCMKLNIFVYRWMPAAENMKRPTSVIRKTGRPTFFLRINEISFRIKKLSLRIISWYTFLSSFLPGSMTEVRCYELRKCPSFCPTKEAKFQRKIGWNTHIKSCKIEKFSIEIIWVSYLYLFLFIIKFPT